MAVPRTAADGDGREWQGRIDLDALLAALVLVPNSYPRNRFFGLYRWTEARRVRRRAARIRGLIRDLCDNVSEVSLVPRGGAGWELRYWLAHDKVRSCSRLDRRELELVKLGVLRARGERSMDGSLAEALSGVPEVDVEPVLARLFRPTL